MSQRMLKRQAHPVFESGGHKTALGLILEVETWGILLEEDSIDGPVWSAYPWRLIRHVIVETKLSKSEKARLERSMSL